MRAEPRSELEPLEERDDEDDVNLDMLNLAPDMRDGIEEIANHPVDLHPSNRDFNHRIVDYTNFIFHLVTKDPFVTTKDQNVHIFIFAKDLRVNGLMLSYLHFCRQVHS